MDGRGSYEFQKIEADTEQFGSWAVDGEILTIMETDGGENFVIHTHNTNW